MRLFLMFLVVLNLLFAAWQYWQPAVPEVNGSVLPVGIERLVLLSERQDVAVDEEGVAGELSDAMPVVVEPEVKKPARVCYTLGPFRDEEKVEQTKSAITEYVDDLTIRKREQSEQHRFWVYVAPQKSREMAVNVSKQLAKKKIKDYYIIRSGEKNNGISLGHFKEKKHADRRVKKLSKLGFDVKMEVIYQNFLVYWLDYSAKAESGEGDDVLHGLVEEGVARIDRDCQ